MKPYLNSLLCLVLLIGSSCGQSDRNTEVSKNDQTKLKTEIKVANDKCIITNEDERLKKDLFPFSFKYFNTSDLPPFFSKNTKIDSIKKNVQGSDVMIYKFIDGSSYVSFFVKPSETADPWFYLDHSSITSNLIAFKNGVKIGIGKEELAKILRIETPNCDTLLIQEGDLFVYYDFIFTNDKLSKIEITPSE